jgi:hypothetical protein
MDTYLYNTCPFLSSLFFVAKIDNVFETSKLLDENMRCPYSVRYL